MKDFVLHSATGGCKFPYPISQDRQLIFRKHLVVHFFLTGKSYWSSPILTKSVQRRNRLENITYGVFPGKRSWRCFPSSGKWPMSRRSQVCRSTGSGTDAQGYWEGPEGRQKMQEIQEMKELLQEAGQLAEKFGDEDNDSDGRSDEEKAADRAEKVRDELARKASEQARKRKEADTLFELGQQAYGRGVYDKSVSILESALELVYKGSELGGEIQIWLAMAYDADGRRADCILLYKQLEAAHPSINIRRQAKDLRFITEAPKLKISPDEMVSLPILDSYNQSSSRTWSQMVQEKRRPKQLKKSTKDNLELVWTRPRWESSPYFWVAVSVWFLAVGVSLTQ